MRCEEIRELLLTDYIDGELAGKLRGEVDGHADLCPACRELRRAVVEGSGVMRKAAGPEEPPAYIWERVRAEILAASEQRHGILARSSDRIKEALAVLARIPRPALAFAAAAMVIIAVLAGRPSTDAAIDAYLAEQMDFMTRLDTIEANGNGFFDMDLRTGAENIL